MRGHFRALKGVLNCLCRAGISSKDPLDVEGHWGDPFRWKGSLKRIRSQIMSTYAGQMSEMYRAVSLPAVCYLQKDASPKKKGQMLCWSIAADVYQTHPAFFLLLLHLLSQPIYSLYIWFPPCASHSMAVRMMTPLWRGMTSPARDHVNLVGCHVPRDTYFMAFQAHETCMLAAKVKCNRVSA